MTNQELLKRPEMFADRKETNYSEKELIKMINQESVLIIGKVFDWDNERRGLRVTFGKGLIGFIPEDEITIVNMRVQSDYIMPKEAFFLIEKTIIAEVIDYNCYRREFKLSRKKSMKKAIYSLKVGDIVEASIKAINEDAMIVDVGAGNIAWMSWRDFSKVPFKFINQTRFEIGDWIKVSIEEINDYKIQVSRKKAYRSYQEAKETYKQDEEISAMITSYRRSSDRGFYENSYWVEIEPNVPGILDTHERLTIGKFADLRILSIKDKGFKLRLSK